MSKDRSGDYLILKALSNGCEIRVIPRHPDQQVLILLGVGVCLVPRIRAGENPTDAEDTSPAAGAGKTGPESTVILRNRLPRLVLTAKGTLLAFSCPGDNHPGDLVVRRSEDGGRTWEKQIRINPAPAPKQRMQFGSASVVADRETGTVWCFYNRGTRRWDPENPPIRFTYSEDDGRTWKAPVRPYDDTDRFGTELAPLRAVQGTGIQLENGRLLANVYHADKKKGPAFLYSDDHGKTWKLSHPIQSYPVA